jgi:Zn-dependent protease with chaperone function
MPTWGGYLLVAVVLVLWGTFAGQIVHNAVLGDDWAAVMDDCATRAVERFPDVETVPEQVEAGLFELDCKAPAEHRRALVTVGGAALVGLFGLLYMRVWPAAAGRRLERHRPLTPAGDHWQQAANRAATDLGVDPPVVLRAPVRVTRPFALRWDGKDRVLLPPGVTSAGEEQVQAVIAHEVAHVAARDTRLVWLCRAMWWALPPVLAVPVVLTAAEAIGDGWLSGMLRQPLWWQYLLRAAGILAVAYLVTRNVDRMREHQADLEARDLGHRAGLEQLLEPLKDQRNPRWRRALALHPSPARRLDVIADPAILWRISADEAFAAGVLSALVVSSVYGVLNPGLVGTPLAGQILSFSGAAGGILLAVVLGPRIWAARDTSLKDRVTIMASAAVGSGVGFLGAFSNATSLSRGTDFGWHALITTPLMVAGAIGIAFVLADARSLLIAILFGGAYWLSINIAILSRLGGLRTGVVYTLLQGMWVPAAASVLVGITAWILLTRQGGGLPRHDLVMVAGVTVAVVVTTAAMRISGRVRTDAPEDDWWAAAAAGVVVALVLLATVRGRGARYALAVAPFAVVATSLLMWTRYPGDDLEFGDFVTVPLTMTAIAFLVLGSLLATAEPPVTGLSSPHVATAITVAVVGSIGATLGLESAAAVLTFPTIS